MRYIVISDIVVSGVYCFVNGGNSKATRRGSGVKEKEDFYTSKNKTLFNKENVFSGA